MRSDAARLRQILVNLVTNAVKFTVEGRVEVRASSHEHTVRIDVVDDGVGIPEAAMATLFERFTQVDESSTRVHGGTGLGLALSRDLARRMGGELFATSTHGVGSTFTLLLPVDAESMAHLRQAADTSSDDSQPWDPQSGLRMLDASSG
jgi:signal transduction histidine kinase